MFQKKNLVVNCDVCDTRKMKEEDYTGYESITINADLVLVSSESKSVLARFPVVQNCDAVLEVGASVPVNVINGPYEITPETAAADQMAMVINGSLHVETGSEHILEQYEKILVNGSAEIPENLAGFLSKIQVNGSVNVYPADCTVLEEAFIMDKFFPLRACRGSRFYAGEEVVIWDKAVDLKKLVEKQIRFVTPRLILPESMVEDSAELFDIQTEYVVAPEGLELVYGDTVLNQDLIREKGSSLFIYGDLEVEPGADMNILAAQIERLVVTGSVTVSEAQEEAYLRIGAACSKLNVTKGKILKNGIKVKVDQMLLDRSPEGIEIRNTASVIIADDVTPEAILDKLSIINCASVICSKMQESAVTAVSVNAGSIGEKGSEGDAVSGLFAMLKDARIMNGDTCIL
ncbi:MAG: hypothetical protein ACI4LN_08495 [Anaerovoracaceae bacterium]